ncbi:hypothetical protein HGO38_23970 [Rhizobium sp. CG5]|uniref:STM4504/CBY_0614 family protein n=1 Tax=Rhizobium sp. CG5 TaxID=2726076 RepID=UPI0020339C87|nr:hypothetical protein [Rhizobium sp. CG5]MCM2476507.1 hypothetical protein [Rhizobium sp. CG5]
MAVTELFSKRRDALNSEPTDVFQYDRLPEPCRVQILYIFADALGDAREYRDYASVKSAYDFVVKTLRREYGVFKLINDVRVIDPFAELHGFIMSASVEKVLDAIELASRLIERTTVEWDYLNRTRPDEIAKRAIAELNQRFREHAVGYQYANGEIVRVDSELVHAEVVKPAIALLRGPGFAGPQEEFMGAFEHYRHGRNKEALVDCLKAFESTMKAIIQQRGWTVDPKATAKDLIRECLDKELVPQFWQNHFSSLRSGLESAIPTGRNKLAGHGQGDSPTEVPNSLTGYMLHMTAATIVFLVTANSEIE